MDPYDDGVRHLEAGRHEAAIAAFDAALESDPDDLAALNNRGVAKENLGRYAEALEDFDRAIALDPSEINPYTGRANVLQKMGREAAAAETIEEALRRTPGHRDLVRRRDRLLAQDEYDRARALFRAGRHAEAVEAASEAIRLDPQHANAYSQRAAALLELGEVQRGRWDLRLCLELQPGHASAWYNLGISYSRAGELHAALIVFEEAASLGHPQGAMAADLARATLQGP